MVRSTCILHLHTDLSNENKCSLISSGQMSASQPLVCLLISHIISWELFTVQIYVNKCSLNGRGQHIKNDYAVRAEFPFLFLRGDKTKTEEPILRNLL